MCAGFGSLRGAFETSIGDVPGSNIAPRVENKLCFEKHVFLCFCLFLVWAEIPKTAFAQNTHIWHSY